MTNFVDSDMPSGATTDAKEHNHKEVMGRQDSFVPLPQLSINDNFMFTCDMVQSIIYRAKSKGTLFFGCPLEVGLGF
jgi:glutaredoxin